MKQESRPKRWANACDSASEHLAHLREAFQELKDLQEEFQDWRDNLPENLESSALADKLDAMCEYDFEYSLDEVEQVINDAEDADLPLGFGRD